MSPRPWITSPLQHTTKLFNFNLHPIMAYSWHFIFIALIRRHLIFAFTTSHSSVQHRANRFSQTNAHLKNRIHLSHRASLTQRSSGSLAGQVCSSTHMPCCNASLIHTHALLQHLTHPHTYLAATPSSFSHSLGSWPSLCFTSRQRVTLDALLT